MLRCSKKLIAAIVGMAMALSANAAQPSAMGARFDSIERQAEKIVTVVGGVYVVTSRTADGALTDVLDRSGQSVFQKRLRTATAEEVVHGGALNARVFSLWQRRQEATHRRDEVELEPEPPVLGVTTVYPGYVAESRLTTKADAINGQLPTFITRLWDRKTHENIGVLAWYEDDEALVWRIDGLGEGEATPALMKKPWPHHPDMAWANVQIYSLLLSYESKPRPKGLVAAATASIRANDICPGDPGCTGLHWLDGTILRWCCDEHDRCYETQTPCCSASSWIWWFGDNWSCVPCNIAVVECFLVTIVHVTPFRQTPNPTDPTACYFFPTDAPSFCPANCSICYWL